MMKGKVIKKFRDKKTKSIYAVGDTIERDEARIAEINKVGGGPFIKAVSATETEATVETEASEPETTEGPADANAEGEPAATRKKTRTTRAKKTKE